MKLFQMCHTLAMEIEISGPKQLLTELCCRKIKRRQRNLMSGLHVSFENRMTETSNTACIYIK